MHVVKISDESGIICYGEIRVVCNKRRRVSVLWNNCTIVIVGKTEIEVFYSKSIHLVQVKSILWLLIM